MAIKPTTLKKAISLIVKYAPFLVDGADRVIKRLRSRKKPESKPLEQENDHAAQGYEKKIDICVKSLQKHVKAINRNIEMLKEHNEIIEEMAMQSENSAKVTDALSRWVTILIWTTGISFMVAVIAILVALFK